LRIPTSGDYSGELAFDFGFATGGANIEVPPSNPESIQRQAKIEPIQRMVFIQRRACNDLYSRIIWELADGPGPRMPISPQIEGAPGPSHFATGETTDLNRREADLDFMIGSSKRTSVE